MVAFFFFLLISSRLLLSLTSRPPAFTLAPRQLGAPSFVCSHPRVHHYLSLLAATNAVLAPYCSPSLHRMYKVRAHLHDLWPWNRHAGCFGCVIVCAFLALFFLADTLKIVQPSLLFLDSHRRLAHFSRSMCRLLHCCHHRSTPLGRGQQ